MDPRALLICSHITSCQKIIFIEVSNIVNKARSGGSW